MTRRATQRPRLKRNTPPWTCATSHTSPPTSPLSSHASSADLTPQPAASASALPPPVQQPPRPVALPARRRPAARATARRPRSSSFYPLLAGLTTLTTTRPTLRIPCAKAYSRPPTRTNQKITHKNNTRIIDKYFHKNNFTGPAASRLCVATGGTTMVRKRGPQGAATAHRSPCSSRRVRKPSPPGGDQQPVRLHGDHVRAVFAPF